MNSFFANASQITLLCLDVMMLEDFNVNLLSSTEFCGEIQCSFRLEQLIKTRTHITAKSKTLLDLTFSSDNIVVFAGTVELNIVDHWAIYCGVSKNQSE